ncbi:MAG TPA: hypothetical protein VEZ59_00285 [Sphingopyxis sp.]|nr:hypothetical protein [Sphingopyxis sp.]
MHLFRPFAALLLLAAPLPALACSVAPGYRVPTNMQLAADADLILLATVTGGTTDPRRPDDMAITLAPVAALKGVVPDRPLTLPFMLANGGDTLLSNPYDLESAHPQSFAGACVRYAFPLGTRALFFLKHGEDGGWTSAGGAFSRWAEDVLTDEAPWLRAVRFYLEVEALPEAERHAALVVRRDEWRALTDDPVAQLLADDIDRQLAGPNKPLREEPPTIEDNGPATDAGQAN